jgi:putative chitinase
MSIKLLNVAKNFKGLPHQIEALERLDKMIESDYSKLVLDDADWVKLWRSPNQNVQQLVTIEQIHTICNSVDRKTIELNLPGLNAALATFKINTPIRIAHFLAQVLHECGEFQYLEELASGEDYEGRTDLGNIYPGDGKLFKGRGLMQVTGRDNYRQLSVDTGIDFLGNPYQLSSLKYAALGAGWFWHSRGLNQLADRGDHAEISRRVNGMYPANGQNERDFYLKRALAIDLG